MDLNSCGAASEVNTVENTAALGKQVHIFE